MGHQLIVNIEAMNDARKEAAQAEEGRLAEAARLEEKIAEVASLQEALQKEGQALADLRATLEEERKKAETEVSELKAQIPTLVLEAMVRAVEEFKTSSKMRDLKVEFGQAAFIKGFELCQEKVVGKFLELDLSFLDEASDGEAGPSEATAGLPPAGTSSTAAAAATDLPGAPSSSTSAPECPVEALPLTQGIPMKLMIRDLRRKVRHLTKKSKKLDDELHRLRKSHSEVTAEATCFRDVHKKGLMDYIRRKADFMTELEELRKRASDQSWTQASKISSLEVELAAAREKIDQLEGSSSWLATQADRDQDWSKKFSNLQKQLQDTEVNYNAYRVGRCGQVEDYRRKLKTVTDEVACLRRQLSERVQSASAQDSDELRSLRGTMEELSVALGQKKAEL
ncbi:uncharacterized protein [Elaeis guineensis]|uniref:uncharacterized protein n=1 Tax=Elaeis guineensis var. tenera TaxID=51953 RepID=UPI003C6D5147